ncbi:MBL fold metallo-hydrolase [bacterium]|nr:MBL fold metallo-hydrolase [bacterium]
MESKARIVRKIPEIVPYDITRIIVGELDTNCYLLSNDEKSTLLIDPGADGCKIVSKIDELLLKPVAILLTHGHYDHIGAVNFLAEKFKIPIYAHHDEIEMLANPDMNFSSMFADNISVSAEPISQNILIELGFPESKIIDLPGHTKGGIGIIDRNIFISGDTVFANGGIGRTDLPYSNVKMLVQSIEKILKLPDNLILYPGHGGRSILRQEKQAFACFCALRLSEFR